MQVAPATSLSKPALILGPHDLRCRSLVCAGATDGAPESKEAREGKSVQQQEVLAPYAYTEIDGKVVYLHDWVMGTAERPTGTKLVHANGDTTDNRRANLAYVPLSDPRPAAPISELAISAA
jgi:hypothetical protein